MQSKRGRLDRFISQQQSLPRKQVRALLQQGRVFVDGVMATAMDLQIDEFSRIQLDDKLLQANEAVYLMLHKPVGVVSATKDKEHQTVIDLLQHPKRHELHIAGRLDLNSSGLLLLTNDSRWSEALMSPKTKVDKRYRVTLANAVSKIDQIESTTALTAIDTCESSAQLDELSTHAQTASSQAEALAQEQHQAAYIAAFANGMYFGFEDITTLPAQLEFESSNVALVRLREGKYHQIKRMFGRFRNPVVGLHRLSIGELQLDPALAPGQSRELTAQEIGLFNQSHD